SYPRCQSDRLLGLRRCGDPLARAPPVVDVDGLEENARHLTWPGDHVVSGSGDERQGDAVRVCGTAASRVMQAPTAALPFIERAGGLPVHRCPPFPLDASNATTKSTPPPSALRTTIPSSPSWTSSRRIAAAPSRVNRPGGPPIRRVRCSMSASISSYSP